MAAQVLANDTIVAYFKPAGSTEVGKLTHSYIITNLDIAAKLVKGGGKHNAAIGAYAYIIAKTDTVFSQCADVHLVAQPQEFAPTDAWQVKKAHALAQQ